MVLFVDAPLSIFFTLLKGCEMNYSVVSDVFRLIDVILGYIVLWQLLRNRVRDMPSWSPAGKMIFWFVVGLIFVNIYGGIEKLWQHAPPATSPFLLAAIYLVGIWGLEKTEGVKM